MTKFLTFLAVASLAATAASAAPLSIVVQSDPAHQQQAIEAAAKTVCERAEMRFDADDFGSLAECVSDSAKNARIVDNTSGDGFTRTASR